MRIATMDGVMKEPWETLYGSAAEIGFDGVELGVFDKYEETKLWSSEGRSELSALADKAGIVTSSICIHSYWKHSFANPDAEVRARALGLAKEAAEAAQGVGAANILVPLTCPKDVAEEEARQRWIEGVGSAAPAAEEAGVVFCLENVNQPFADAPGDVIAVVDAINSPAVKTYYDAANAVRAGRDPLDDVAKLGARIAQVHVKEAEGTLLGEGVVPWKDIIPALRKVGYDGWLVLETQPTDDPPAAARHNLAFVKKLLSA